jgi:hypothetical protein
VRDHEPAIRQHLADQIASGHCDHWPDNLDPLSLELTEIGFLEDRKAMVLYPLDPAYPSYFVTIRIGPGGVFEGEPELGDG